MESHYRRRIRSWITGHHAYKNIWSPTTIGEELDHGLLDTMPTKIYGVPLMAKN